MVERFLIGRQHFAARDAQLPFDEIMAGDRLGHRMFDLEPGVHLHEVEGRVTLGIDSVEIEDEFDRAGALVTDGMGGGGGGNRPACGAGVRTGRGQGPPR